MPEEESVIAASLRIETFFLGRSVAHGVFQDRSGKLRLRFTADIEGYWEGDEFVLDERFLYDSGRRETRVWRIRRDGADAYVATAGDVVGVARGSVTNGAIMMRYTLNLPISGRYWAMRFDDIFFRVGDVVINRARMSKFGVRLAEATIAFRQLPAMVV